MARRIPSIAAKAPKTDRALTREQAATLFVLVDPTPTSLHPDGRVLHATASHSTEGAFARFGLDSGAALARAAEVGQRLAYRYGLEMLTVTLSALASVATAAHGGSAAPVTESTVDSPPTRGGGGSPATPSAP